MHCPNKRGNSPGEKKDNTYFKGDKTTITINKAHNYMIVTMQI